MAKPQDKSKVGPYTICGKKSTVNGKVFGEVVELTVDRAKTLGSNVVCTADEFAKRKPDVATATKAVNAKLTEETARADAAEAELAELKAKKK